MPHLTISASIAVAKSDSAKGTASAMNDRKRMCVALVCVALGLGLFWAALDRPVAAPEWTGKTAAMSYNPSGLFSETEARNVSRARIEADFATLAKATDHIRTYSVSRGLDVVPDVARTHGLTVSLGLWLSGDHAANEREIDLALQILRENHRGVERIFVGNEAVLRGDLTAEEVAGYMRRVKRALPRRIDVSTAEPWHVWRSHPILAEHSDFIGAHFLPFWEGPSVGVAMANIRQAYYELSIVFWNKPIVMAEVGWPSQGRNFRSAVASLPNQAAFIRDFVNQASNRNWDYYLIEAFDQPWKIALEGTVGAYWGMFDAFGNPKFAFAGPVSALPDWPLLALVTIALTLVAGGALLTRTQVTLRGQFFLALTVAGIVTGVTAIYYSAALTYADMQTWALFIVVLPLALLAAGVILSEAIEWAHAMWRTHRRHVPAAPGDFAPFVSIHVPAYNEPSDMMIETLNALSRLDYPNFEVIVLDNNTKDPAVWRPVEEHCKALGERFRFFHFDNVKGFKAGALNIALKLTDARAEAVAVIDSDYQVDPQWLTRAMPNFADPQVAIVQGPQDYRDATESAFKAMAYQEYAGFFRIGMVERNEDNAIIQHGTMTIVRRAVMDKAGWAEWCITEDTELGLRVFQDGWRAVYMDESLGRGLMPDTFTDFKAQRFRWVYGAMQIAKRHLSAFSPSDRRLTLAQKYHFIAGWLPWLSDGLSLIFVGASLIWSALMVIDPVRFDAPLMALGAVAISLFAFKVVKTLTLYPVRVGSGIWGAGVAALAGLSLSHTVARAVLSGILTSGKPFFRTPKMAGAARPT
ncbi:MAG TPA: hypothetical protein DCL48_10035, partial [Alphaproteobacteria bacterium]|nr:hypothetical protein [Alphaproteobacteria bacterium]